MLPLTMTEFRDAYDRWISYPAKAFFCQGKIRLSIKLKIAIVRIAYLLGIRTERTRNFHYLLKNLPNLNVKSGNRKLLPDSSKMRKFLLKRMIKDTQYNSKLIILGPLVDFNEASAITAHLTSKDFVAFMKPREWKLDTAATKIYFLNNWAIDKEREYFSNLVQENSIVYFRNKTRKIDRHALEIRVAQRVPRGLGAMALGINNVMATVLRDFPDSETSLFGVNFHLQSTFYCDDYKTSLKEGGAISNARMLRSLAQHDWLFNYLLTRHLKAVGNIKFDVNAERLVHLPINEAIDLLERSLK